MAKFKCHSGPIEYHLYLHSLKSRKTLTFCFIELKCHRNVDAVLGDEILSQRRIAVIYETQRTLT